MILNKLFKVPKNKRFEYSPKYYDAQKEELQERINAIKGEQNPAGEAVKFRLEKRFEQMRNSSRLGKQKQQSNVRIVIIIFILAILVYILLH